jgi:small conductance mechanosensitive channel
MLLVFRPFKVGDVINAAGVTAKVNAIELFTTTLDTFDNRRIIVPNGKIYGDTIENITYHPQRRCDVNVGIEYSADLDKTREVLTKAAESLDALNIKGEGRGFQVFLIDLGDSSVNWVVRFWTTGADFWSAKEQLTRAVKQHLDEAGIGIPFPQMDIHLDKLGE